MTRVCLVGDPDCTLQYELLSRETSREALSTYDLHQPFANSIAVRTVSIGAAISLLNDLNWYLIRFVDEALVLEPSVSDEEWLSRELANELRNGDLEASETAEFCKIYGLERPTPDEEPASSPEQNGASDTQTRPDEQDAGDQRVTTEPGRLVEPLYVRRTTDGLPEYDLRNVDETVVVRVTEAEYAP